jgi:hypothetical protein
VRLLVAKRDVTALRAEAHAGTPTAIEALRNLTSAQRPIPCSAGSRWPRGRLGGVAAPAPASAGHLLAAVAASGALSTTG